MRHLLVAAALLLTALIVTLAAASVLENMAASKRRSPEQPYVPGAGPASEPPLVNKTPATPERSRSLSLLLRRS